MLCFRERAPRFLMLLLLFIIVIRNTYNSIYCPVIPIRHIQKISLHHYLGTLQRY